MKSKRKALSKIASVVLILAICITTVFGGIESVFAAAADATYTVNVEKTIVPFGDKGTAYLTFDLESGFVSGNFTLLENLVEPRYDEVESAIEVLIEDGVIPTDAGITFDNYKTSAYLEQIIQRLAQWTYEFERVDVTVKSGTPVSGTFNAADFAVTNKMYAEDGTHSPNNTERHKYDRLSDVSFTAAKTYKSVTFQLDYEYEYHVRVGADNPTVENGIRLAHAKYSTEELDQCTDGGYRNLTYTDPTLIDANDGEHTASKNQPEGTVDFFHAHRWDWRGQTPVHTNTNGYYIYEAKCTLCSMTHHQLGSKFTSQGQSHNYYEISGINVKYEDNGTVSVNVHIPTPTQNEELVICKKDGTTTKYGSIEVTPENYDDVLGDSYFAKTQYKDDDGNVIGYDDNALPHGTKMYTIKGLSATDLKSELLITRLVDKTYIGASHPFSLEEYALNVISGENVYYPEATTEAQKKVDKEVAAAFVNYAVNASNALDNKITSEPKSTVKWSGEYKIQNEQDFINSLHDESGNVGTGTADDPYIITTPEQLFYISCFAGENSKDKYYKVSDFVGEFDMGAYAYEATPEQIAGVVPATHKHTNNANTTQFQGNFDGNGVIIYGLYANAWQTGLFPKVSGNVSFKNLTVLSSSFTVSGGNAGAGAIVGKTEGNTTVAVENCAVKWCYFDSTASGNNTIIGTVVGMLSVNSTVSIENCIVLDNKINNNLYDKLTYPYGGLAGYAASYGANVFRSNICIGNTPYSVMGNSATERSDRLTKTGGTDNVYHGNYTDQNVTGIKIDTNGATVTYNGYEIKQLTVGEMTGKNIKVNMPYLDWSQWFTVSDDLPRLRTFYTDAPQYGDIMVWDGTIATEFEKGSGTESDPYIIANPSQLAYLVDGMGTVGTSGSASKGKYYKIADGIMAFDMNGFKNINLYSTVENLESGAIRNSDTYNWGKLNSGAVDESAYFAGNFDGNHVRIFNMYSKGWGAGLFPFATNYATIKNISVENSYIQATGYGGNYGAGGIVGAYRKVYNSGDSSVSTIENCSVHDCYILNTNTAVSTDKTAAHAVGCSTWIEPHITNCFFANNTLDVWAAQSSDGTKSTVPGGVVGSTAGPTAYLTGVVVVSQTGRNDSLVKTGLIGGNTNYTFTDCYTTDAANAAGKHGVTILNSYNDILGGNAVINMPALHWSDVWYAGRPGEYPMLYDDGISNMPSLIAGWLSTPVTDEYDNTILESWDSFVENYDSTFVDQSFTTLDTDLNMYSSGLNLKDNPYLLVTFKLSGKYLSDKENVVATFKVGDQTITVKGSEMINNAGAGRYHLVRLKDIDITNLYKDVNVNVSYNGEEILTGVLSVAGFVYSANKAGPEYENYALAGKALTYYSQVLDSRKTIKAPKYVFSILDDNKNLTVYNRDLEIDGTTVIIDGVDQTYTTSNLYDFHGELAIGQKLSESSKAPETVNTLSTQQKSKVVSLTFADEVAVSTGYELFSDFSQCIEMNLEKLNTKNVTTSMQWMFYNCTALKSYTVGKKFDTSRVTDFRAMYFGCNALEKIDLSMFNTQNAETMAGMFTDCRAITELDLSGFDTSKVTDMSQLFVGTAVTELDLSSFDTSNVTNMQAMFLSCKKLKNINFGDGFDTSSVTDMAIMFDRCTALESLDLSDFDTSNVTKMWGMFNGCGLQKIDISSFNTSKVINMASMFANCSSLTELVWGNGFTMAAVYDYDDDTYDGWYWPSSIYGMTDYGKQLEKMFSSTGLISLDLSGLDASSVTSIKEMFANSTALKSVNLSGFDASSAVYMQNMFFGCMALEEVNLDGFNIAAMKIMDYVFSNCFKLKAVDLSVVNAPNVAQFVQTFNNCYALTTVNLEGFTKQIAYNGLNNAFANCSNLERVYVSEGWNVNTALLDAVTTIPEPKVFSGCTKLVGDGGACNGTDNIGVKMAKHTTGYFTKVS